MGLFTPIQRIRIYKESIKHVKASIESEKYTGMDETFKRRGLCSTLSDNASKMFNTGFFSGYDKDMKKNFPEIWKQKPSHFYDDNFWFSKSDKGMKCRIKILENAIKELETNGKEI